MKGYKQTCHEVDLIGQINFHGDGVFTPNNWYHNIRRDNGKTYIEAVVLLGDIVSWYLPIYERDEVTGKTVSVRKKFKADKLQRTYESFAEHYGMTKDQARNALRKLSDMNLIDLDFRTVDTGSQKLGNVLFVGVNPDRVREITFTLCPQKPIGAICTETDSYAHENRQLSAQKPIAMPSETETYTDLSTDLSTDQSTKKEKEILEPLSFFPSGKDQDSESEAENLSHAQTKNPNIQDPQTPKPLSPALPENIGKPIHRSDRPANQTKEREAFVTPLLKNQDFLKYLFREMKRLKTYFAQFPDTDYESHAKLFVEISCEPTTKGDRRFREMQDFAAAYDRHRAEQARIEQERLQQELERQREQEHQARQEPSPEWTPEKRKQIVADLRRKKALRDIGVVV
jgi:hypothetical protein